MRYNDLKEAEKHRFILNHKCPICRSLISLTENFVMVVEKVSRSKLYTFYHEGCYYGKRMDKPEVQESETNN